MPVPVPELFLGLDETFASVLSTVKLQVFVELLPFQSAAATVTEWWPSGSGLSVPALVGSSVE